MVEIFVLCQAYPSDDNKYAMAFVHPRIKGYLSLGYHVSVISFETFHNYVYDGVSIYTSKEGLNLIKTINDVLIISHAPNLKNHLPFICKIWSRFSKIILFFHGHEVLSTKAYYPVPYSFNTHELSQYRKLKVYDYIKLPVMKCVLKKLMDKKHGELVFVSQWMLEAGMKSMNLDRKLLSGIHVINNGISSCIPEAGYKLSNYKADFVTIRPLDQSKYSVDLVLEFAEHNPHYSFHIYGRGTYFNYRNKPDNVILIDDFLAQKDIPSVLNSYKCALMPTRLDAQGVMMCEMAAYGIPIIVSDLPVCHEMLDGYENVMFVENNCFSIPLSNFPPPLSKPICRFSEKNTIGKELNLIENYFH